MSTSKSSLVIVIAISAVALLNMPVQAGLASSPLGVRPVCQGLATSPIGVTGPVCQGLATSPMGIQPAGPEGNDDGPFDPRYPDPRDQEPESFEDFLELMFGNGGW